jgi:hypothetical protein
VASVYDELTADWLKNNFLLGVDLTLDDGTAYPDAIFNNSIRAAVQFFEHELGIHIDQVHVENERHDGLEHNRVAWWPFRLDRRPVLDITAANIQFGSYAPVTLPVSWIQRLSDIHGQIHLIPSQDSLGSYQMRTGIPLILGDILQPVSYVPGYFDFTYVAGFGHETGTETIAAGDQTATVTLPSTFIDGDYTVTTTVTLTGSSDTITATIKDRKTTQFTIELSAAVPGGASAAIAWRANATPYDIKQAIGYKAALLPLDVAGDLIAGAGVASISSGFDGLHSSINTTSSATNCLVAETRIALATGELVPISELVGRESFEVACVDEEGTPVIGQGHSARATLKSEVWEVELSTGKVVECSSNHPFRLYDGHYVKAEELVPGEKLTPCSLVTDSPHVFVQKTRNTGRVEQLYDITVEEHHCFGIEQGVIVHNSGYGARVLQFERELKALLPALRGKYRVPNFGVI